MYKRWGERLAGIFFIILFSAAGALGIGAALSPAPSAGTGMSADASPGPSPGSAARFKGPALSLVKGVAQAAFQERFDAQLALRGWAVAAVAEARWAIFGQGYPGVLVGSDSWLFSTEEFEDDLGYLDGDIRSFAAKARDTLRAKGIALLVLPIPAKARVYYQALPPGLRPPHEGRYASLLAAFSSLGLPAVDLAEAYRAYDGGRDLFLRGDTHWTPEGAQLAARRTAALINALPVAQDFPVSGYQLRESGEQEYSGDLLAFLPARGAPWRPLPAPEPLRNLELVAGDAGGPVDASALFGAQSIPVALVGTSYSASPDWHFEDFLKAELSFDVLNLSTEGEGPFQPLLDALSGTLLEDSGVRVLIWELPERYVPGTSGA